MAQSRQVHGVTQRLWHEHVDIGKRLHVVAEGEESLVVLKWLASWQLGWRGVRSQARNKQRLPCASWTLALTPARSMSSARIGCSSWSVRLMSGMPNSLAALCTAPHTVMRSPPDADLTMTWAMSLRRMKGRPLLIPAKLRKPTGSNA